MVRNKFFIADTHFGDSNIIRYENRPFQNVEDMDAAIIEYWNTLVTNMDEVFVLGDFSFHNKEKSSAICKSLNGKKILIMGNHDTETTEFYYSCGFHFVSAYPIILDDFWMLSHQPLYLNSNMPYGNLFGHVHSNKIYTDYSAQSFCVSAERINYTPIAFEDIKKRMGLN